MKITPTMWALAAAAAALAAFLYLRSKGTVANGIDLGKPGGW
jgi:hypothetical protein